MSFTEKCKILTLNIFVDAIILNIKKVYTGWTFTEYVFEIVLFYILDMLLKINVSKNSNR